jgi:hypothetical protein
MLVQETVLNLNKITEVCDVPDKDDFHLHICDKEGRLPEWKLHPLSLPCCKCYSLGIQGRLYELGTPTHPLFLYLFISLYA